MIHEVEFVSIDGLNEWLSEHPFHIDLINIQKIVIPTKYLEWGTVPKRVAYILFYQDKN